MKKLIFILSILCAYSYISNAQQPNSSNRFVLSGTITQQNTRFLSLSYTNHNGKWVHDTCYLKNGAFTFTGYINLPASATISGHTKSKSSYDPNFTTIFLEPANIKVVLVENDFKNAKTTGSHTQRDAEILYAKKKPISAMGDELDIAFETINTAQKNGDTSIALKNKRAVLWDKHLKLREQEKKIDYAFITTHPASYLSPYLMDYYFGSRKLTLDSAEIFFRSFDKQVQQSFYGKMINNQITARKLSSTGSTAPILANADINGNEINLATFKGKSYVLLDFWASWCVPCRAITPRLKQIYRKYHQNGLDIISISWDTNKKPWIDAINKDSTNSWYNIYGNLSDATGNGLRNKYAIASIPTLILIDKNGVIIGRYRGDGEDGDETDLYNRLDKIFAAK